MTVGADKGPTGLASSERVLPLTAEVAAAIAAPAP